MWPFGAIKNTYKKSEAATVLQNILEMQASNGNFQQDPAKAATVAIDLAWNQCPHIFEGKLGVRPHKLTLAIAGAASVLEKIEVGSTGSSGFYASLAVMLGETGKRGHIYPFTATDWSIIEAATNIGENWAVKLEEFGKSLTPLQA